MNPPAYIGRTALIATNLWRQIPKLQTAIDPCERRYLFTGVPGVGKTDLAEHLAAAITGESFERVHARMAVNVEVVNGQSWSVELVRAWQAAGIYRPLFGDYRVYLVDEIDAISLAALCECRSFLDRLPRGTIFLATTNKPITELQEQLQSRFKVFTFAPVADAELCDWLVKTYDVPPEVAMTAAQGSKGNVRAAKTDVIAWKESQP